MALVLREHIRAAFAPPRYLALPLAGIDLSTSGVKAVRLTEGAHGLSLVGYADTRLPSGAYTDGEVVDRAAIVKVLLHRDAPLGPACSGNICFKEVRL